MFEEFHTSVNPSSHDYVSSSLTAPNFSMKNIFYFGLKIQAFLTEFLAKITHLRKVLIAQLKDNGLHKSFDLVNAKIARSFGVFCFFYSWYKS